VAYHDCIPTQPLDHQFGLGEIALDPGESQNGFRLKYYGLRLTVVADKINDSKLVERRCIWWQLKLHLRAANFTAVLLA